MENKNIYVDLLLTNAIQSEPNQRVDIKFYLNQSQQILSDTTDYKLSVVRFALNTETLPIFIPQMSDMQTNTTIYSVTMEYNGVSYQQFMNFTPQNPNPMDEDEIYYVYSYQYVVYLMNTMINSCLIELNNLTTTGTTTPPKIGFDINTQLCGLSFNATNYGFNETNKINIYFNNQMYALISSLPASHVNLSDGMDYQVNNKISEVADTLFQEYKTIELWNPVSSVVFTTNMLPIYSSVTAPLQVYENGQLTNNDTGYHFQNILTDFIGNDLVYTPYIEYVPSIYRFIDLKPHSSIRNIDIQTFWMNKNTGKLKPLYLIAGGSCSVKLLFTSE